MPLFKNFKNKISFINNPISLIKFSLLLFIFFSCNQKQQSIKPVVKDITESVYATGLLKSENQYKVFSTVSGIVNQVLVKENDNVKIGTPLFLIVNDAQEILEKNAQLNSNFNSVETNKGKLDDAQSLVKFAQQKLQNDETMLQRQQNLWKQQIGTKVELEQRELSVENSRTTYQAALQKFNDLQKQLNFAAQQAQNNYKISNKNTNDFTVKSNIEGKVYQLNIEKGELITPQVPLAILGNNDKFILEMQVDEYDINTIQLGMQVMVVLNSYKDSVFTAVVSNINPIMNIQSKTFTVEANFTKRPNTLFPSVSFEANILIKSKKDALLIPRNYLQNDTLVNLSSGEQRVVKTGLKDFQMIEILSGISKDDALILPK